MTAGAVPLPNHSALWWNADESGWGINLNHQNDILFATWFTYDLDGRGMWLTMTAGRLPGGAYEGVIHRTTGIPFAQIAGFAAYQMVTPVGQGRLSFGGAGTTAEAEFTYTLGSVSQVKRLTRQVFGALPVCAAHRGSRRHATNYQDLWWNPAEPGWGLNITHQGDNLFVAWFTYRADGSGQWLVGPAVARQPTGEFTGRLYRTTGVPLGEIQPGAPASQSVQDVGSLRLDFSDGENATLTYTLDGVSQSKQVSRQVFGTFTSLCR